MADSKDMPNSGEPIYLVFGLVENKDGKVLAIKNKELKPPGRRYEKGQDEKLVLRDELKGKGIDTDIRNYKFYGENSIQVEGINRAFRVYQVGEFSGKPNDGVWVDKKEIPLLSNPFYIQKLD